MANPVLNSTQSFWRSAIHEIDCHRSTPELPPETDVLIIGAGYAGAATAYYLLKENAAPPSVTIIDAREVCAGATGRNGKFPSSSTARKLIDNVQGVILSRLLIPTSRAILSYMANKPRLKLRSSKHRNFSQSRTWSRRKDSIAIST